MYISYDLYRIFYFVAKYRSFTKAADVLLSNQPNVTRAIKRLEQALGCTLFIRSNRGVQLTPEGEKLYGHIAAAMDQIQEGEQQLLLDTSMQGGVINIGASEIALHHMLLPVLKEFRRMHPAVRLRIFNSTTRQTVAALRDRVVDIAVVTTPLDPNVNFIRRDLGVFQEVPICGQAYASLAQRPLSLNELSEYPFISLGKGSMTYELYSTLFRQQGLAFAPDIEAATANQIVPLVCADLGIGFVPEHTAQEAARDGSVHILQLHPPLPKRAVCLLKRRDLPLSIAAAELERMLLANAH